MEYSYDDLSAMHMDVLREIGNIGAGNAATSLSVMLNQPVDITPPKVNLVSAEEAAEALGGAEVVSYGVLVHLTDDIEGMIMFILDKQFAHKMLNVLMGQTYESFDDLDEMGFSAIKEVGNILSAAYINSIAELTGLRIDITPPFVSIDMVGSLLMIPAMRFGSVGDKVLFIEENFSSNQEKVLSHMILFAEMDSLNLMLGKLGLM